MRPELPDNPQTATLCRLEHETSRDVFAFCIRFPKAADDTEPVTLSVASVFSANDALHAETATQFAAAIVDDLMKRGRFDLLNGTNWPSVTAAIQRLVTDWNRRHHN